MQGCCIEYRSKSKQRKNSGGIGSTKLGIMRKPLCLCVSACAGHALAGGVVKTSFV